MNERIARIIWLQSNAVLAELQSAIDNFNVRSSVVYTKKNSGIEECY